MGAFASIVRGALAGANDVVGNTQTAQSLDQANQRERDRRTTLLQQQTTPHAIAIQGLQQKAAALDPQKDQAQLTQIQNEIQRNINAIRSIIDPKAAAKSGNEGIAQDYAGAQAAMQGVVPYSQTPAALAETQRIQGQIDVAMARAKPAYKNFLTPDGRKVTINTNVTTPDPSWTLTGEAAAPKPMKGTLVKSKQSPTGWAQTWVDSLDPSKIIAWQPTTPPRYQQGTTSTSTSTDPFGVTTSSQRTTQPIAGGEVDLGDAVQLPEDAGAGQSPESTPPQPSGTPAPDAPKPAITKGHAQLQQTRRGQQSAKQLDANGHIPANARNPQLVQAANSILDGMDVDKLPIPQRDRAAAMEMASQYGWKGQGTFTPKEQVLLKEAGTFIQEAANNSALSVLDNPASRAKVSLLISNASRGGVLHNLVQIAASQGSTPQEMEFLRMYNQLVGTISGLSQLTRSGRVTEQGISRLMQELPNPNTTNSAADAKERLKRLQNELNVATGQGSDTGSDIDDIVKALKNK